MIHPDPEGTPPHHPRNRGTAESKLRRGGKHCPLCLARCARMLRAPGWCAAAGACRAHVIRGKHCLKCGAEAIWENKAGAACQRCGRSGTKRDVLAPEGEADR